MHCSYRFGLVTNALRALQSSAKTSMRINSEGLLSLQLLIPYPKQGGGPAHTFTEFWVCCVAKGVEDGMADYVAVSPTGR